LAAIFAAAVRFTVSRRDQMQELSNGKVRRSSTEWKKIVSRQQKSGKSAREFCDSEGISLSSFTNWSRKLLMSGKSDRSAQFVEVSTERASSPEWLVEVSLPNGCRLRLRG
jgi:hypothetical protein